VAGAVGVDALGHVHALGREARPRLGDLEARIVDRVLHVDHRLDEAEPGVEEVELGVRRRGEAEPEKTPPRVAGSMAVNSGMLRPPCEWPKTMIFELSKWMSPCDVETLAGTFMWVSVKRRTRC